MKKIHINKVMNWWNYINENFIQDQAQCFLLNSFKLIKKHEGSKI